MILALSILAAYIIGTVAFYAADGWFKFTIHMYGDDAFAFILGWPLTLWYILAIGLRVKVEEARDNYDKKAAETLRIRVQAEKELAATMRSLEQELDEEEEFQPKKRKRAR